MSSSTRITMTHASLRDLIEKTHGDKIEAAVTAADEARSVTHAQRLDAWREEQTTKLLAFADRAGRGEVSDVELEDFAILAAPEPRFHRYRSKSFADEADDKAAKTVERFHQALRRCDAVAWGKDGGSHDFTEAQLENLFGV